MALATLGTLRKLEPRATTHSPHPALCAGAGGPIAIKVASSGSGERSRDSQELLEPHVVGYVSLDRASSQSLGSGQLATVRIAESPRPLGHWLLERSERWLTAKRERWTSRPQEIQLAKVPAPFRKNDSESESPQLAEQPTLDRVAK